MKRAYIALGVAAFLVCAAIFVPARLLSVLLDDYGVYLLEPNGTIWSGSGKGVVAGTQLGVFSWSFAPRKLFEGRFGFDFRLQGEFLMLIGTLSRGIDTIEVHNSGFVEPRLLNQVLANYGLEMSGRLKLNLLKMRIDGTHNVEHLSGEILWDGGTCRYQIGATASTIELPPIVGSAFTRDSNAVLRATEVDSGTPLFELTMEFSTGWTHVSATKRLIDLADYPWHSEASNDAILFQVSHQLYGSAD